MRRCEMFNDCKRLFYYFKKCKKIYEDCKYSLKYVQVRKKYIIFECLRCEKGSITRVFYITFSSFYSKGFEKLVWSHTVKLCNA